MAETLDDDDLVRLAGAVDSGKDVDWDQAEASADGLDTQQIIRQLRVLADVAVAHRRENTDPRPAAATLSKWGPLEIQREIGRGGYGTVYVARDSMLERTVALKILHDVRASAQVIQEGRMLERARHPNVVTVHGVAEYDGLVGLWMELVEGLSLREFLSRNGTLSAHEATLIGIDLCRAVAAVHKAGLLHRDIKVSNVMREAGGRIVLMDFGTGRIRTESVRDTSDLVGTPRYIAPEILTGGPATIAADIYSLGVVLYHLVTRSYPVAGDTLESVQDAHLAGQAVPLSDRRPDLPTAFVRVVARALAPDPAHRYRTAGAMQQDLIDSLELGVGALQARPEPVSRRPAGPALAVLSFESLGPDQDIEYFCHGLTQELITGLAKTGGMRVCSNPSSLRALQQTADIRAICRQLDVDALLGGAVRKSGDRLRITAQLIGASDGSHLLSEAYDRQMSDVIGLQEDIAQGVVERLRVTLTGLRGRPMSRRHTDNPRAYHWYQKGRFYWSRRYRGGLRAALECFQKALGEDAGYALAHAGVADVYTFLGFYSIDLPKRAFEHALKAAEEALRIDSELPEAHTSRALIHLGGDWDWAQSALEFRRAIELDPGDVQALPHVYLGWQMILQGDIAGGVAEARRAQEIDPMSLPVNGGLAYAYFLSRRFSEAVTECENTLELDPNFIVAIYIEAMALAQLGRLNEAILLAERAAELSERAPFYLGLLGNFYARTGDHGKVRDITNELETHTRYVPPHAFAYIYAGQGDIDRAVEWEARAYEDRASPFNYFSPVIDNIHGDPRHIAELRRMGWRG
jgi:eukaryotic-like serine/threonine-protein kinase